MADVISFPLISLVALSRAGVLFSEWFILLGLSFKDFIGKKAKALLLPFLFFFVLWLIVFWASSFITKQEFVAPELWKLFTLIPANAEVVNPLGAGAIWFLMSLFEIYVIYYIVRTISKKEWFSWMVSVVGYLLSIFLLQNYAIGSLIYLIYTFTFFIYFVVAHLNKEKVVNSSFPVWLLAVATLCYLTTFVDSGGGYFLLRFKGLLTSFSLIIILIWGSKGLMNWRSFSNSIICKFILFEGKNSVTILGIHMLAQGIVGAILKQLFSSGTFYYILLFIIEVILCNVCIVLFNEYVPFLVNHKPNR